MIQHLDMNKGRSGENWTARSATLNEAKVRCDQVYDTDANGVRQEITDTETGEGWVRADGNLNWRPLATPNAN
jgi:hypothetical protein